jgi:excisionase family DNA binding protein
MMLAVSDFLHVQDVADRLDVSVESVRMWIRSGQLAAIQLGRRAGWRIDPEDLRQFLEQRKRRGPGGDDRRT